MSVGEIGHERYMRRVIEVACGNPDAPFGCVIADRETGEVLAKSLNQAEKEHILHGEIDAILRLLEAQPDVDWSGSSSTPPPSPARCARGRSFGPAFPTLSSAP